VSVPESPVLNAEGLLFQEDGLIGQAGAEVGERRLKAFTTLAHILYILLANRSSRIGRLLSSIPVPVYACYLECRFL